MQTVEISIPRQQARQLYRDYKKHAHYSTPIDAEIQRAYQLIAQGRMVIKALESIKLAGVNDKGLPKLAIARADQTTCIFAPRWNGGGGEFYPSNSWRVNRQRGLKFNIDIPGVVKRSVVGGDAQAVVPSCPLTHRPKRGLQNYHILFEAIWEKIVPHDPYLLRRIGKADLWLVCHAWDLTEVERGAMATRL